MLSLGKSEAERRSFKSSSITSTSIEAKADVETNGAPTTYSFAYSTGKSGPWTTFGSGGSGSISVAEDIGQLSAEATGLEPEKLYYLRLQATNGKGIAEEVISAKTETERPTVSATSVFNVRGSSARLRGSVSPDGLESTSWRFEYAPSVIGPWWIVPGASGTISRAEAEALSNDGGVAVSGLLAGLSPATSYYVRLAAENEAGESCVNNDETCEPTGFETEGHLVVDTFAAHALHGEALRVLGSVNPNESPTSAVQSIAIDGAPTGGTFTLTFAGQTTAASGTGELTAGSRQVKSLVTATGTGELTAGSDEVKGVSTATGRFVTGAGIVGTGITARANIEKIAGSTLILNEPAIVSGVESLTAIGTPPFARGELVSGVGIPAGTTIEEDGREGELTLSQSATASASGVALTANLPYNAPSVAVERALDKLSTLSEGSGSIGVTGPDGGPYTLEFNGGGLSGAQPLVEADAAGLTPAGSGSVVVSTVEQGGESYDTRYHFEYEGLKEYEAGGGGVQPFVHASSTPEVDLGGGGLPVYVGEDLPGLVAGESYRFRLVATSSFPGASAVDGETQSLTVPAPVVEAQPACGNEVFRTGLSAHLPDCRAYEQVTPVDKEGAKELVNYGGSTGEGILAGADGDHVLVGEPETEWGAGSSAGISPYVFSREAGKGWVLTAGTAQPEAGISKYSPEVFSPDLTELGLAAEWNTSAGSKSADMEFKIGPPGGPYAVLPPVPRAEVEAVQGGGLVAASEDSSKFILEVEDHTLLAPTHTKSGADLYEYSAGELRQVNVVTGGTAIGTCGARIVKGVESTGRVSSSHAVSADGSRVFFEAVPGSKCKEPSNLYIRVDGESTVDVGAYRFLAANASGSEVLVQNATGEVFIDETESGSVRPLRYGGAERHPLSIPPGLILVSEDLNVIYFGSLDRYDIPSETLRFVAPVGLASPSTSPDGRYLYFEGGLGGLPTAGKTPLPKAGLTGIGESNGQVLRYDAVEDVFQCISCASPFDPAPKLNANYLTEGAMQQSSIQGTSSPRVASANGDYVFFQTPSALLPSDVDGEVEPEGRPVGDPSAGAVVPEHESNTTSVSSDVYEWTKDGIHGCSRLEGCLSLITSGKGGFHNLLLGTDASGEDVFFYTNESLLPRDNDTAGDIYDARVNGGFPEPVQGVECEGDACSTPPSQPNDATPSSSTFNGTGNLVPPAATVKPGVEKRAVKCAKGRKPSHGKCIKPKKKQRKAKKPARGSSNNRRGK